jgi:dienelactone hydrolase
MKPVLRFLAIRCRAAAVWAPVLAVSAAAVLTPSLRAQSSTAPAPAGLDGPMRAFWDADSSGKSDAAVKQLLAAGASFDGVMARVKAGRTYTKQPAGRIALASTVHGTRLDNVVEVPDDYDPSRRFQLRVSLHGGVGREAPAAGGPPPRPLSNRTPSKVSELVLHPRAWSQSEWWTAAQADNVLALVERVKRSYNVDESHVYITGVSDGGTGVYFFAMRQATPWAVCMPLNGHPSVLANPDTGADGELFETNIGNCPVHAVNGGKDRLYPAASVKPLIDMFTKGGIPIDWKVYPDANHDTSWWPEERAGYEAFVAAHPRIAQPETVSWETERTDRYNRYRWLVIDRLGRRPSDTALADVNAFELSAGFRRQLYDRDQPSGRVDATRRGNRFDIKTRGVQTFTLLLSPDVIDFARPVQVSVNGKPVVDATVKKDTATLLKWAARDHDRTMVYGAELSVTVP